MNICQVLQQICEICRIGSFLGIRENIMDPNQIKAFCKSSNHILLGQRGKFSFQSHHILQLK